MKKITSYIMFVMFIVMSPVGANDIYVTQSGANLTLDVLQDGQNNTIGSSGTASTSTGATTNLNIDQVGNSNVITYQINGATYTGVINLSGDSNNVDLNCDSTGSNSSCGSVNAVINFTGSSNDIDLDIGETSDASNADVDIVGQSGSDSNTVAATIVIVKIALVPSIVAATVLLSEPDCPTMSTSAFEASLVSPMSKSISFDEPVKLITAFTLPQDELLPVLSQFKSTSFESPAKLITPVYVAPLI